MSDLVGNPEDRFSHVVAPFIPAAGVDSVVEQKIPDATVDDEDLNLDVVEEKILTEMKALEDQMREMNEEIGELLD